MNFSSCLQSLGTCLLDQQVQGLLTLFFSAIAGAWVFLKRKPKVVNPSIEPTIDDQNTSQLNNINASGHSNVSVKQQVTGGIAEQHTREK